MTSREEAQLIAAGVLQRLVADNVTVGGTPVYLGVWPRELTLHPRAEIYIIRPVGTDVHLALDAVPTTGGINSARLVADTEYVLPFSPSVDTLGFLSAGGNSTNVQVYIRPGVLR